MAKFNHFASENIGFSVLGHLVLLGLVVFLTDFVIIERERFVAPDRIEITMIDLDQIRVSGDKTILYNTSVPEESKKPEVKEEEPKAEPIISDKTSQPIESTSLIEPEKVQEKKEAKQDKTELDKNQAPKKKKRIQVNRNILSLDRTLTVSVKDALRIAMKRCWNIDTTRPDISGMRVVAHLKMQRTGMVSDVWFESAARAESDPAFAYVIDTIRAAINTCQPLRMLPPNEYNDWRDIELTFYPTRGEVM